MTIELFKYHGAGNDFIMVNGFEYTNLNLSAEKISDLCHRRFGIGADGLIIINSSDRYDFVMQYYNSNGLEGTMCGNGGRCCVAFAQRIGVIEQEAVFQAVDGIHEALIMNNMLIRLKMSDVRSVRKIDEGFLIDTGSPHFVIFKNDVEAIDVDNLGRKLRYDKRFGEEGVNVNFVKNEGDKLSVRTYERGVESETYSCGTGAVAVAIVNYISSQQLIPESEIQMKGGTLKVHFEAEQEKFKNIWLEGPAEFVFKAEIKL